MKIEYRRIQKFVVVGISAAAINLGSMVIFVELFGFEEYLLKNLANAISMEISIVCAFACNRLWTWYDAPKKTGKKLVGQFLIFNLAVLTGVLVRIGLFALFELYGLYYLINVCLGIGVAAVLDFILYDKIVFRRRRVSLFKGAGCIRADL